MVGESRLELCNAKHVFSTILRLDFLFIAHTVAERFDFIFCCFVRVNCGKIQHVLVQVGSTYVGGTCIFTGPEMSVLDGALI